jgi:hypothetical protein
VELAPVRRNKSTAFEGTGSINSRWRERNQLILVGLQGPMGTWLAKAEDIRGGRVIRFTPPNLIEQELAKIFDELANEHFLEGER